MSGVEVTIKQKPTKDELERRLEKSRKRLSDFKHVHKHASIMLDRWVQKNFRTEGGNLTGGNWPPFLYGGRVVRKKKANAASLVGTSQSLGGAMRGVKHIDGGAKLLQDTGRLRISFRPFASARTAGIGSELPYSKTHEKGTKNVPKRRMLPISSEVADTIIELFDRHAKEVGDNAASK